MEEAEVPLEHLQEQVHHSAEHSRERWISWVALSTAILAVLAAIAGLLSGRYVNEAMMNQIEASDQWSYYQAKSIKAAVLDAKPALAEPGEMTSPACNAFETERLDCFGSNVRDGFVYGIGRVDQAQIGGADCSVLRHLIDKTDQFFPIIGAHDHDRKIFDLRGLNQRERFE